MIRIAAEKVMWVGRAAVFCVGLAVTLAVILGVATTALAAVPGDPFRLGKANVVNAASALAGNIDNAMLRVTNNSTGPNATALNLQVEPGKPPMRVNSSTEVQSLNVDQVDGKSAGDFLGDDETASNAAAVDGKSADEIGVNGQQVVSSDGVSNSNSPKIAEAQCPAGKVVVGTGYDILGAKSGIPPDVQTDVVLDELRPGSSSVFVQAYEENPTGADWRVTAVAICAAAP